MKTFLGAIALATAGCAAHSTPSHPTEVSTEQLAAQIDGLEAASGGRLGLALFSKDEGLLFAHRGAERFAMCSTFKLALAAMALETARHAALRHHETSQKTESPLPSPARSP